MYKYKTNKKLTTDRLEYYGFVIDNIKDNAFKGNYYLYRRLSSDVHLKIKITKIGNKLCYSNANGSTIFVGNVLKYGCNPSVIEKSRSFETTSIMDKYNKEMDELIDNGILVKKLTKKNK